MSSSSSIPVETILKIALDKSSADDIQDWLDNHCKQWSAVEKSVERISDSLDGITSYGMGLVGMAGVGGVVSNFFQTSTAGSQVALAAGHTTGDSSTWHPYGQAMLQAQAQTGVKATEISAGLVQALQAAGGSPTASQAAMIGGLLAGYGQVTGMTPSQVAQVVTPLLQAANKTTSYSNILGVGATLSSGLSNFSGSQSASMEQLIAQLGLSLSLGSLSNTGTTSSSFNTNLQSLITAVNSAAGSNSIWRNTSLTSSATTSISSGLQNAYSSPSQEAFMQMAGISYSQQESGITGSNIEKIMQEATRLYGTGTTRDIFLRSTFGLSGAKFLETFAPGTKTGDAFEQALKHPTAANRKKLQQTIAHAQAATTPGSSLSKIEGEVLGWIEQNPLTGAIGLVGAAKGGSLLTKGIKGGAKGIGKLLRGSGGDAAGAEAGAGAAGDVDEAANAEWRQLLEDIEKNLASSGLSDAGEAAEGGGVLAGAGEGAGEGSALGPVGAAVGAAAMATIGSLIDPSSAGLSSKDVNKAGITSAVKGAIQAARKKFGKNFGNAASQKWLQNVFATRKQTWDGYTNPEPVYGTTSQYWLEASQNGDENTFAGPEIAQKALKQLFKQLDASSGLTKRTASGNDPIDTLDQAATKLLQAANKMLQSQSHTTGYKVGSASAINAGYGTSAVQAIESTPFAEFTALQTNGSSGSMLTSSSGLSASSQMASYSSSASASGSTVGWSSCELTWYDPALGGTNSGNGQKDPTAATASGQAYSATAYTCAAPSQYSFGTKIAFSWGGKTVTCEVNDRGGAITGSHFDLARAPATALGMISAGVVQAKFKVVSTGSGKSLSSSGGSTTGSTVLAEMRRAAVGTSGGSSGSGSSSGASVSGSSASTLFTGSAPVASSRATEHVTHVHVYVDGRQIQKSRVLRGKK